ncbi:MAG TPA: hypothetical protein PKJ84_05720 [Anaerolineales bacterium]|nr:hypothetical protein [Anaerolineales bacterium]
MKDNIRKHMTVAILQDVNKMEVVNTINIANASQLSFQFDLHEDVIQIDKPKYKLSNGAIDFNRAIDDLLKQQTFRNSFYTI